MKLMTNGEVAEAARHLYQDAAMPPVLAQA